LQGKTVSPGSYTGRVAIVLTHSDLRKVCDGDVVVSPMTDPYFLSAIVRAGALVTDEGGVLSHAAIISREFRIPGVVGTGNATAVLKDGMVVAVDATGDVAHVTPLTSANR
ncbi:MAG: PEP-utilizing enzyme, partial [bacterium]